jgi:hypothetical protein
MNISKAVAFARKSLELEGFEFTPEEIEIQNKLARGEVTDNDIICYVNDKISQLKKKHPEHFVYEKL